MDRLVLEKTIEEEYAKILEYSLNGHVSQYCQTQSKDYSDSLWKVYLNGVFSKVSG